MELIRQLTSSVCQLGLTVSSLFMLFGSSDISLEEFRTISFCDAFFTQFAGGQVWEI